MAVIKRNVASRRTLGFLWPWLCMGGPLLAADLKLKLPELPKEPGKSVVIEIPGLPAEAKKLEFVIVPGLGAVKPFLLA